MLTTPRAILLGLGLIAVAIVIQPLTRNAFITPAHAGLSGFDYSDLTGVVGALEDIASAIESIARAIRSRN